MSQSATHRPRSSVIAGVGELPQGLKNGYSTMQLHAELADLALRDAGLPLARIDGVLTVAPRSDPYLIHSAALAEYLNLTPAVAWTLEAGGAAPAAMLSVARGLIDAGTANAILIVAADLPATGVSRNQYVNTLAEAGPVHPELERTYAPSVPSMFATVARAHREAYGTTDAHFAAVAVHDRTAATLHPNAHFRKPITALDHHDSRVIADPMRLLDCAPVSDGGGAVIVCRKDALTAGAVDRSIGLAGLGFATGHMHLSAAGSLTGFKAGAALDRALTEAGRPRAHIDLAMVYDCYTIAMLQNLEDLGFVAPGQAGPAFVDGFFGNGGPIALNTHGGLLSHGHPARAGGISHLIEAVVQLRGEAGARQTRTPQFAMVHGMGGVFASHGIALLERA